MENLRLPLSLALLFVLFLIWQAWQTDYGRRTAPQTSAPTQAEPSVPVQEDLPSLPGEQTASPGAPLGAAPALHTQRRIQVETDLLQVVIDTAGGDLRELDLKTYPVSRDRPDQPFRLLTDTQGRVFVAQAGLQANLEAPNHHARYQAQADRYQMTAGQDTLEVPLVWTGPSGTRVTKTYVFHRNSYLVDLRYEVYNGAEDPWTGLLYAQLQRNEPTEEDKPRFIYTYTGAVLHSEADRYEKIDFDDIRKAPVARTVHGGWAAMIQHYFAAALLPSPDQDNYYYTKAVPDGLYVVGVATPRATVAPGEKGQLGLRLFLGPKEPKRLSAAAPGLELLVDYGVLTIIAEPLYHLLAFIHRILGNWGWSIIVLTILVKAVFFHLSATSYRSMANMRRVQPRLVALKERYGDDRARMNQGMMELYKKEKINPLGGCLPVVVQIPVFIALYWVLLESVELRQASFMFWITDLSAYDPYFILPVVMGATMFIQQRLNPAPMDPIQQKVMMALPVVFTVFFLYFPSGLVLYWIVNNTLSITQQWYITRHLLKAEAS